MPEPETYRQQPPVGTEMVTWEHPGHCPDCGSEDLELGPRDGAAVNRRCRQCGARWNTVWVDVPTATLIQRGTGGADKDVSGPTEIAAIVERIKSLLAGHPPELQGAVLADCVAIWLAGHHVAGDEEATRKLRAGLLATHCFVVRELTAINAKIMGTPP